MSTSIDPIQTAAREAELRKAILNETQHLTDVRFAIAQFGQNIGLLRENTEHFSLLITQLRNHLAKHFALKVRDGFMDEAIVNEPRLSGAVDHLRAQHAELFVMISEIAQSVDELTQNEVSTERIDEILERLKKFDHALAAHEREESAVLHEATDVDLGGQG